MFDWSPARIREIFDAHCDMTIPRLVRMTGKTRDEIRAILMHGEKV